MSADGRPAGVAAAYQRDFWIKENLKHAQPHYRLRKTARIVNAIANGRECDLLDLGCGPATLRRLLAEGIHYYGIDIAIQAAAPYLLEADILRRPIAFDDRTFDVVVAQGLFEYVGQLQDAKLAEIARLLKPGGVFVVTYTNFGHRRTHIFEAFSNIQPSTQFRDSLLRHFTITKCFPTAHNWYGGQPRRRVVQAVNMHVNRTIPLVSRRLAVEYFFVCSARAVGA